MFTIRRGYCPATITAGVLSALMLVGSAEAAPQRKGIKSGQGARPAQSDGPYAQAIAQLRTTRALLHQANHDYKGHRVKAMHDITQAIHALLPAHHPHRTGTTTGQPAKTAQGQGNNEPQSVSDGQLRQAIQQLQSVRSSLGSSQNGNIATATAAIGRAIQELQTALQVSPAAVTN
jgi:hypothetical protein